MRSGAALAVVLGLLLLLALLALVHTASSAGDTQATTTSPPDTVTTVDPKLVRELRAEHRRLLQARSRLRGLKRTLLHRSSTTEAIQLACNTYGSCSTLWRRARCESGLSARAYNPSGASGLFQFMPSTFHSTPYGAQSIWSPYANALAAGWMQAHGRGSEWTCR